jgi:hypothetical protein
MSLFLQVPRSREDAGIPKQGITEFQYSYLVIGTHILVDNAERDGQNLAELCPERC